MPLIRTDVLLGKFFEPFIFEEVPANEHPTSHVYLKEVELCDIYLGIYGNLYGYEDEDGVSPTEREYDLAASLHKSRLIYIKSIGEEKRHPKETAFIRKVEQEEEELLEIITKTPSISRADLSKLLNISERQVRKIITKLRDKGVLIRKGGNSGKWVINKI